MLVVTNKLQNYVNDDEIRIEERNVHSECRNANDDMPWEQGNMEMNVIVGELSSILSWSEWLPLIATLALDVNERKS